MSERTTLSKRLSKAALFARLAAVSGVPKKQVAAVLDALTEQIKKELDVSGRITVLSLLKIEKKSVPACPTWPAYIKVGVLPVLLPGSDDYCRHGLHTYHESPASNAQGSRFAARAATTRSTGTGCTNGASRTWLIRLPS